MEIIVSYLPLFGILALAFVFWKNAWVSKQDEGGENMSRIAKNIADKTPKIMKAFLVAPLFSKLLIKLLFFFQ